MISLPVFEEKKSSFTGTEISDLQLPDTSHIYDKSGDTPVNLIKALGKNENASAYAFCHIFSDSASRKHFYIGSDDRAKVWINGSKVFENRRQSKELEEARRLQLSMIPENPPEIPGLEIAAYINTATEVGGDYYNFF